MNAPRLPSLVSRLDDPRLGSRLATGLGTFALAAAAMGGTYVLMPRLGVGNFTIALVGLVIGLIYLIVSFKYLTIPYYMTILSVAGFRFLWSVKAPLLPDLYLDRMMLILLLIVFGLRFFAEGRRPKGPFALDYLLLAHGIYLFVHVMVLDFYSFNSYNRSILVPYLLYFLAKNIFETRKQVQVLLAILLVLGLYYSITSIAQKFEIKSLLYPTTLRLPQRNFPGRSVGPFGNPGVFGVAMGMIIPINLYFLSLAKNKLLKLGLIFNMGLSLAGLFFTYTRGPWVAGFFALVAVVAANHRHYLKYFLPVLVLAPAVGIFVLGLGEDQFMKRRVENENTIGSRLGTGVTALRVWRDYPFFGCGYRNFPFVREDYIKPVEIPGFETIRFVQFRENGIHDNYLGVLAEDGLVGFGMMIGSYLMVLRIYLRIYGRRKQGDHIGTYIIPLFFGIMVCYLVGGLFFNFRFFSTMGSVFFMAAGIANGYVPEREQKLATTRT